MTTLYSYVLRYDDGAAPNPFWDVCTLAICKPAIRRTAREGDWVVGTGSMNAVCNDGKRHDLSGHLVYAMKITDILTLAEYDRFCRAYLSSKIPDTSHGDWQRRMGDCIYDFSRSDIPAIRPGVHNERNRERDLSGCRALLSRHFYYFGENTIPLPPHLIPIIKKSQGHRKIENSQLINAFEDFIQPFALNTLSGDPQLKHAFDGPEGIPRLATCSGCHLEDDSQEDEEAIC